MEELVVAVEPREVRHVRDGSIAVVRTTVRLVAEVDVNPAFTKSKRIVTNCASVPTRDPDSRRS
jgi:hypothetical protein